MVSRNCYPHFWLVCLLFIGTILKSNTNSTTTTGQDPKTTVVTSPIQTTTPPEGTTNETIEDGRGNATTPVPVTTSETVTFTTQKLNETPVETSVADGSTSAKLTTDDPNILTTTAAAVTTSEAETPKKTVTTTGDAGGPATTSARITTDASDDTTKAAAVTTTEAVTPAKTAVMPNVTSGTKPVTPGNSTTRAALTTSEATAADTIGTSKVATIGAGNTTLTTSTAGAVMSTTSGPKTTPDPGPGASRETAKATTDVTQRTTETSTGVTQTTRPAGEVTSGEPTTAGPTTAQKVVTTQTAAQTPPPPTTQPPHPPTRIPPHANRLISLRFNIVYNAKSSVFRFKRDVVDPDKERLEANLASLYMNETNGFNSLLVDSMPQGDAAGASASYTVSFESAVLAEDCNRGTCMLIQEIQAHVIDRIPQVAGLPNRTVNAASTKTDMETVLNANKDLLGNPCLMNQHVCAIVNQTDTCKFTNGTANSYVCENVCMRKRQTVQNYCQSGTCYAEHQNAYGYNGRVACSCSGKMFYDASKNDCVDTCDHGKYYDANRKECITGCRPGSYYDSNARQCRIGCAAFHFLSHNNACVSYWAILGPLIALLVIAALLVGALVYMSRKGQDKGDGFGYVTSNGAFKNPTYQGTTFG